MSSNWTKTVIRGTLKTIVPTNVALIAALVVTFLILRDWDLPASEALKS